MATFDDDQTTTELGRFCPKCGQAAGGSNFCSSCGHNMGFPADRTLTDPPLPRPKADGQKHRGRAGFIIAGGVVALVAVAVAVIVLLNGHHSKASAAAPATNASTTYHQQLTKVMAPLISANQTVSSSLTAMDGSKQTTDAAKTRVAEALAAVVSARGGLRVLSVPGADATLSGQVQQALTADNGYLESVSSTLATPTGTSAGQLQTLATGAQSALVNLDPVMPGASSSVTGTDNLVSWVQGANASYHSQIHKTQTVTSTTSAAAAAPAVTPASGTPQGLRACDQNISVNSATSCQFADNVFAAYATVVQDNGSPVSTDVAANSPVTGDSYTDDCQYNSSDGFVLCSHGTDLVQFPEWAASVYNP